MTLKLRKTAINCKNIVDSGFCYEALWGRGGGGDLK